jgi:hypothetical protein
MHEGHEWMPVEEVRRGLEDRIGIMIVIMVDADIIAGATFNEGIPIGIDTDIPLMPQVSNSRIPK